MAAAIALLDDIERITTDPNARAEINGLLVRLGMWLGRSFVEGIKGKRRKVRRLASGVITFGDAPLPVPLYGSDNADGPDTEGGGADRRHDPGSSAGSEEVIPRTRTKLAGDRSEHDTPAGQRPSRGPGSGDRSAQSDSSRREGVSFTKVHRGDWIRTSDLLTPRIGVKSS